MLIVKGLIISSGYIEDFRTLTEQAKNMDYILAADGGIRYLIEAGIKPDAVIGDFDSIDEASREFILKENIQTFKFPIEKDETDTELAIRHLLKIGCDDITLVGVTGSRLDHTLANIYLLKQLLDVGVKGKIFNNNNTIYLVNRELILMKKENYYISLIPISTEGIVVTLKGFYYPLENFKIEFGSTLGISNKIVDEFGKIEIHKGEALIIESRD
jgi:thiamine pyrophosphokinase